MTPTPPSPTPLPPSPPHGFPMTHVATVTQHCNTGRRSLSWLGVACGLCVASVRLWRATGCQLWFYTETTTLATTTTTIMFGTTRPWHTLDIMTTPTPAVSMCACVCVCMCLTTTMIVICSSSSISSTSSGYIMLFPFSAIQSPFQHTFHPLSWHLLFLFTANFIPFTSSQFNSHPVHIPLCNHPQPFLLSIFPIHTRPSASLVLYAYYYTFPLSPFLPLFFS